MREAIRNYFLVTKPGIVLGNSISVAAGFFLASKGRIDMVLWTATILGTSLVVASGCVFNNYLDRTLDRRMVRTSARILAKGNMSTRCAVGYALALGVAGATLLWTATNILCFAIVMAGFAVYVGIYSLWLKRTSVYATLIGSLAGSAPPVAGYCAVNNGFDVGMLILFLVFVLWQMPHCYAIAVFRLDDYAAAEIPVVPVKKGVAAAKKRVVVYIAAFMIATAMLTFGGYTGYLFLMTAVVLNLVWLYLALSGYRTSDDRLWAKRLLVFSLLNILALSIMMSIDCTAAVASHGFRVQQLGSSGKRWPGRPA